jgi:AcrR family transcriptional regulator
MPATKVTDDVLLEKVAEVFRLHGYEGASIRLLSKATGLERASLYHRFPGGKEEMACVIVGRMYEWFEHNVFAPLKTDGSLTERLQRVATNLRDFYRRGTLCARHNDDEWRVRYDSKHGAGRLFGVAIGLRTCRPRGGNASAAVSLARGTGADRDRGIRGRGSPYGRFQTIPARCKGFAGSAWHERTTGVVKRGIRFNPYF